MTARKARLFANGHFNMKLTLRKGNPRCRKGVCAVALALCCAMRTTALRADGTPAIRPGPVPQAPPPAPPVEHRVLPPEPPSPRPQGPMLYSIGDPTDEEQLYLEYINRSRADPTAEGVRLANTTDPDVLSAYTYFGVNLALMQNELATNPPVPPLAFNSRLIVAERS